MILGLVLTASASANADCKIVVQLCKPLGIRTPTRFADSDSVANAHPNSCLQRARAYHSYCNSNQEVGAEFYVNNTLTISSYVTATSSNLWTKSAAGHWIYIPGGY